MLVQIQNNCHQILSNQMDKLILMIRKSFCILYTLYFTWVSIAGEAWFGLITSFCNWEPLLCDISRHVIFPVTPNRKPTDWMVESWIWIVVYVISSQNWRGFFVASRIRSVLACVEVVTSKVMSKLMSHSGHVLGVGWQPPGQKCHAPGPGPNSSYRQNGGKVCAVQHIVVESCQLCQGAILTLCRSVRRFINSEVFFASRSQYW